MTQPETADIQEINPMTLTPSTQFVLPDAVDTRERMANVRAFQDAMNSAMVEGRDWGTIAGHKTLLKPGAETIIGILGLSDNYEVVSSINNWAEQLFHYEVRCTLKHIQTDQVVATGLGSCNSMETKYRYRIRNRTCPECHQEKIRKSRPEYGDGWYCNRNEGGCGANFYKGHLDIESQSAGRVENEYRADQVNTILKMAKKRAQIDAALSASQLSHVFTQDVDEIEESRQIADAPQSSAPRNATPSGNQRTNVSTSDSPQSPEGKTCVQHKKSWGKTRDGKVGHPLGNNQWCYRDEVPEQPSPEAHRDEDLPSVDDVIEDE